MPLTHPMKLAQARRHLENLREELRERAQRVHRDLTRQERALSADFAEQATEVQNDSALQVIGSVAEAELAEVEEALRRIDQGEYGLCRECGQAIAPPRLAALPQAVTCSACAR
jgi:DnaK suppressor protein